MMTSPRRAASFAPLIVALVVLIGALALLAITSGEETTDAQDIIRQVAPASNETRPVPEPASRSASAAPVTNGRPVSQQPTSRPDAPQQRPRPTDPSDVPPPADAKDGRPPLEFSEHFLELGVLEPGTFHMNTVLVTNVSDETLNIRTVYTGCVCATAYFTNGEEVLEPMQTAELTIEIESGWTLTNKAVSVTVATMEYRSGVRLTTKFSINNIVAARPSFVNARDRREGRISLSSLDGQPFRVLSANGAPAIYDDSDDYRPGKDDPRTAYTIRWDMIDEEIPPRLFVIETDHPRTGIFALAVYSREIDRREREYIRGSMKPDQYAINLGYIAPGETREATVKFGNVPEGSTPDGVFGTVDDITGGLTAVNDGVEFGERFMTFTVTLGNDFPEGTFERPMEVTSGDASYRIWFYGICTPGGS